MYQRAGTIGVDEHGFRAEGDRLAEWASQTRQIGVDHYNERLNLVAEKAQLRKAWQNSQEGHEITAAALRAAMSMIEQIRDKLRSVAKSSDPVLWANTLEEIAVMLDV
jgi:hypothetical protein